MTGLIISIYLFPWSLLRLWWNDEGIWRHQSKQHWKLKAGASDGANTRKGKSEPKKTNKQNSAAKTKVSLVFYFQKFCYCITILVNGCKWNTKGEKVIFSERWRRRCSAVASVSIKFNSRRNTRIRRLVCTLVAQNPFMILSNNHIACLRSRQQCWHNMQTGSKVQAVTMTSLVFEQKLKPFTTLDKRNQQAVVSCLGIPFSAQKRCFQLRQDLCLWKTFFEIRYLTTCERLREGGRNGPSSALH